MAITRAWTDPDNEEMATGDVYDAPNVNAILGNLKWLYESPRVTLVRETSFDVDSAFDKVIEWSSALVDTDGGWDSGSPTVYVVQRAGVHNVTFQLLWPESSAGTFRRWRVLVNGDPAGGNRPGGVSDFVEFGQTIPVSVNLGDSISIDIRHDAGETLTITPESPVTANRWRSPILKISWDNPNDGTE